MQMLRFLWKTVYLYPSNGYSHAAIRIKSLPS